MEKVTSNHKQNTKIGKRVGIDDLLKYIKKNKDAFKSVGCIDLNEADEKSTSTSLEKLNFQDLKKVTYLPEKLANIFKLQNNKYLYAGTLRSLTNVSSTKNNITKENIKCSLFSSVITCLKQSFLSQPLAYQAVFIGRFMDRLKAEIKGNKFIQLGYKKYKWDKVELYNDISHGITNCNVIKYLSDYLHINIFVLDIDEDSLFYGGGDTYVPYKKTLFLIKHPDDTFEPFFTEQSKVFTVNDGITKIIKQNFKSIQPYVLSNDMDFSFFETMEDLGQYCSKIREDRKKKEKELKKKTECDDNDDNKDNKNDKNGKYDESQNAYDEKESNSDTEENSIWNLKDISDNESEVSESDDSSKPKKKSETRVNSSMTLKELQKIAKDLGLEITESNNGKKKPKTKMTLLKEIKESNDN